MKPWDSSPWSTHLSGPQLAVHIYRETPLIRLYSRLRPWGHVACLRPWSNTGKLYWRPRGIQDNWAFAELYLNAKVDPGGGTALIISPIERATTDKLLTVTHFSITRIPLTAHFIGQVSWNLLLTLVRSCWNSGGATLCIPLLTWRFRIALVGECVWCIEWKVQRTWWWTLENWAPFAPWSQILRCKMIPQSGKTDL